MDSSSTSQSQVSSDESAIQVANRWTLLPISGIDKVEVINIKPYSGPVTDKLKPGVLGSADLKIVFSSTISVDTQNLAARVHTSTSLFSKEVRVELGTLSPLSIPQTPNQVENTSHGVIVVPLLRMDGDFPLFDKLPISGSTMHIKVAIPGVHSSTTGVNTCTYYIRLRADYTNLTVEIRSISRSLFDTSRISETVQNFFHWVKGSAVNLKDKVTSKKSVTNTTTTDTLPPLSVPPPSYQAKDQTTSTPHQN